MTSTSCAVVPKQQVFRCTCSGLKPSTVHAFTFDAVDRSQDCKMDTTSWPAGTANGALGAPLKSDTTGKLVFDFYFTPTVAAALDAVNQTTNSFIGNKLFAVAAVGSTASKVVPISAPPAPTPAVP